MRAARRRPGNAPEGRQGAWRRLHSGCNRPLRTWVTSWVFSATTRACSSRLTPARAAAAPLASSSARRSRCASSSAAASLASRALMSLSACRLQQWPSTQRWQQRVAVAKGKAGRLPVGRAGLVQDGFRVGQHLGPETSAQTIRAPFLLRGAALDADGLDRVLLLCQPSPRLLCRALPALCLRL